MTTPVVGFVIASTVIPQESQIDSYTWLVAKTNSLKMYMMYRVRNPSDTVTIQLPDEIYPWYTTRCVQFNPDNTHGITVVPEKVGNYNFYVDILDEDMNVIDTVGISLTPWNCSGSIDLSKYTTSKPAYLRIKCYKDENPNPFNVYFNSTEKDDYNSTRISNLPDSFYSRYLYLDFIKVTEGSMEYGYKFYLVMALFQRDTDVVQFGNGDKSKTYTLTAVRNTNADDDLFSPNNLKFLQEKPLYFVAKGLENTQVTVTIYDAYGDEKGSDTWSPSEEPVHTCNITRNSLNNLGHITVTIDRLDTSKPVSGTLAVGLKFVTYV